MALEPLFMGELNDVMIVPVSVSYEKPLEEQLFVYELLGVPKPKESTLGLLKSLTVLEQNYGSMYFDFGEPISVKEFFGERLNRFAHALEPAHVQTLTKTDLGLINELAHEVKKKDFTLLATALIEVFLLRRFSFNNNVELSYRHSI
jgi:glyceronephosphate O-acyltransferase